MKKTETIDETNQISFHQNTNALKHGVIDFNGLIIADGYSVPTFKIIKVKLESLDNVQNPNRDLTDPENNFLGIKYTVLRTGEVINASMSIAQFEAWQYSKVVQKGTQLQDIYVSLAVAKVDKTFGYWDKATKSVKEYWKTGTVIREVVNVLSAIEVAYELKLADSEAIQTATINALYNNANIDLTTERGRAMLQAFTGR